MSDFRSGVQEFLFDKSRLRWIALVLILLSGLLMAQVNAAEIPEGDAPVAGEEMEGVSTADMRAVAAIGVRNMLAAVSPASLADNAGNTETVALNECMGDVYDRLGLPGAGTLNCTANDVDVAAVTNVEIVSNTCTFDNNGNVDGGLVTFTATYFLELNATTRYDIGLWFASDGGNTARAGGSCNVSTPPYGPPPDFYDADGTTDLTANYGFCSADGGATLALSNYLDGDGVGSTARPVPCDTKNSGVDTCGAINPSWTCEDFGSGIQDTCGDLNTANSPVQTTVTQTVACADDDQNGLLDLPYCVSWEEGASLCLNPEGAVPGTKAKCNCDDTFDAPLLVEGGIIVQKETIDVNGDRIVDDPTLFDFSLLNSADQNVIGSPFQLTGQVSDGQGGTGPVVQKVFSPLLAGDYTLTEGTPPTGWILFGAACDSNLSGAPIQPLLPDGDIVLGAGETLTCQFVNQLTTPVTVSYFAAVPAGEMVDIRWQTATETGTAGFNVYAEISGDLVQLNEAMIASHVVDSLEPTDYAFSAQTDATVFYLEEVSIEGKTDRFGPYELGVEYGSYIPTRPAIEPAIFLPLVQR